MDKLNKTFIHGQILKQEELQAMADKIDELVESCQPYQLLEEEDYEDLTASMMKEHVLYCEMEELDEEEEEETTTSATYSNGYALCDATYSNGYASVGGAAYSNGYATI